MDSNPSNLKLLFGTLGKVPFSDFFFGNCSQDELCAKGREYMAIIGVQVSTKAAPLEGRIGIGTP